MEFPSPHSPPKFLSIFHVAPNSGRCGIIMRIPFRPNVTRSALQARPKTKTPKAPPQKWICSFCFIGNNNREAKPSAAAEKCNFSGDIKSTLRRFGTRNSAFAMGNFPRYLDQCFRCYSLMARFSPLRLAEESALGKIFDRGAYLRQRYNGSFGMGRRRRLPDAGGIALRNIVAVVVTRHFLDFVVQYLQ